MSGETPIEGRSNLRSTVARRHWLQDESPNLVSMLATSRANPTRLGPKTYNLLFVLRFDCQSAA
jgi:hypothetical protein